MRVVALATKKMQILSSLSIKIKDRIKGTFLSTKCHYLNGLDSKIFFNVRVHLIGPFYASERNPEANGLRIIAFSQNHFGLVIPVAL